MKRITINVKIGALKGARIRMNKAFDEILDKLKQIPNEYRHEEYNEAIRDVVRFIERYKEEYNNGWIPCSERLPDECVPVNVTWINRNPESYYAKIKDVHFSATAVYYNSKWYWYSSTCVDYLSEYGKNDFDLVDKDIDIIAWQPLPQPYQPKGE